MSESRSTHHSVAMAFVRSAVRGLTGAQRERVMAQAGIAMPARKTVAPSGRHTRAVQAGDAEPAQDRVPAVAFAKLWMAVARELDDEFFGLDSRRMKVGSFALLCRAVAAQATVEQGLRVALRGFAMFLDDIEARLVVSAGQARIEIDNRIRAQIDPADARRFADETLLVMLHGLLCWLVGRRVPLSRVEWAYGQPAHVQEYRRMYSAQLQFDRPLTMAVFDARLLGSKASISPGGLAAFLRDAPQSVFLKQVAGAGWVERVRRQLKQALTDGAGASTVESVAQACQVSPATLRRRLEGEGAGWQALKDGLRHELAVQWLTDKQVSIEQVALRLGYNDAPSFHRAFKHWTGRSPGSYRLPTTIQP